MMLSVLPLALSFIFALLHMMFAVKDPYSQHPVFGMFHLWFTMAATEVLLNGDRSHTAKAKFFGCTLLSFHAGVACSYAARVLIGPGSIWLALLPLGVSLYVVCLANGWLPVALAGAVRQEG